MKTVLWYIFGLDELPTRSHEDGIKTILGIRQRYSAKGVDENDLLIIACASVEEIDLVSEERPQRQLQETRPIGEFRQCADMLMSG